MGAFLDAARRAGSECAAFLTGNHRRLMDGLLDLLASIDWPQLAAAAAGLVCVALLVRQNVWTWPIGLVYAAISIPIFVVSDLPGQALLHGVFVVFNGYGWWYWTHGGRDADAEPVVTRTAPVQLAGLVGLALLAALPMGLRGGDEVPMAVSMVDAVVLTLTLAAMWLSARKKLENWPLWLVVDVLSVGLYISQGLHFYAVLYLVYIGMAVFGWRAWRASMDGDGTAVPA